MKKILYIIVTTLIAIPLVSLAATSVPWSRSGTTISPIYVNDTVKVPSIAAPSLTNCVIVDTTGSLSSQVCSSGGGIGWASTTDPSSIYFVGSGNVGIGTTTPFGVLQVSSTTPTIIITNNAAGTNLKHWLLSVDPDGNFSIGTSSDKYATTSIPSISITNSGNLGIGTSSPYANLTIIVDPKGTPTGAIPFAIASTTLNAGTRTMMYIDPAGNLLLPLSKNNGVGAGHIGVGLPYGTQPAAAFHASCSGGGTTPTDADPVFLITRIISNGGGDCAITSGTSSHGFADDSTLSKNGNWSYNSFDQRMAIGGNVDYDHVSAYQVFTTYDQTLGTNTLDRQYGMYFEPSYVHGFVNNVYTIYSSVIEHGYCVTVNCITNFYSVYVPPFQQAVNNWSLYSLGTTTHFANVGRGMFGTTTLKTSALFVTNPVTDITSDLFRVDQTTAAGATSTQVVISSSGNLGLGTTSPYAPLSVVGQAVAAYFTATTSTASTLPYASTTMITATTASTTNLVISGISGCSSTNALTTNASGVVACGSISGGSGGSSNSKWATSTDTTSIYPNTATKVGIGTTTPNWPLQVSGVNPFIAISDTGTAAGANSQHWYLNNQNGVFKIGTSSDSLAATSTYFSILNGGNIELASSTCATTIGVCIKNNNTTAFQIQNPAGSSLFSISSAGSVTTGGISNSTLTSSPSAAATMFNGTVVAAASVDWLKITKTGSGTLFTGTNGGNFGIGTSTPLGKLSITATSTTDTLSPLLVIAHGSGTATTTDVTVTSTGTVFMSSLTPATAGTNHDVCINSTTFELVRETTGTCVVSSRKFKHDITKLDLSGLSLISKLEPISYSYNDDDVSDYKDKQYGFIAEDVAAVDPHFAKYGTDGLPRTLDDRALLAASIKAIQEQQKQIEELKKEVKALKTWK